MEKLGKRHGEKKKQHIKSFERSEECKEHEKKDNPIHVGSNV